MWWIRSFNDEFLSLQWKWWCYVYSLLSDSMILWFKVKQKTCKNKNIVCMNNAAALTVKIKYYKIITVAQVKARQNREKQIEKSPTMYVNGCKREQCSLILHTLRMLLQIIPLSENVMIDYLNNKYICLHAYTIRKNDDLYFNFWLCKKFKHTTDKP